MVIVDLKSVWDDFSTFAFQEIACAISKLVCL